MMLRRRFYGDIDHPMYAVLIHGMGRTRLSMAVLARRLRLKAIQPLSFAYTARSQRWDECLDNLRGFIDSNTGDTPFALIGHSLGSVLLRPVCPILRVKLLVCSLPAPL